MARLEFFFDCRSPWTYLAFHKIEEVARRGARRARLEADPGRRRLQRREPAVYEARANPTPARAATTRKDLADWARLYGLAIGRPPVFPVNSVKAMRGAFVAQEHGVLPRYARAVFETYWGELARHLAGRRARPRSRRARASSRGEFFAKIATPAIQGDACAPTPTS